MFEFKLPDVGKGMHEAEILRWHVSPGDPVKMDQPMLEIQTDKAVVEIPAPVSGTVSEIKALVGKVAQLGEVLITFQTSAPAQATSKAVEAQPAEIASVAQPQVVGVSAGGRVRAAPAVR